MDSKNSDKKKYFDIAPPQANPVQPTVKPAARQTIKIDDNEETKYPPAKEDVPEESGNFANDTLLDPPEANEAAETETVSDETKSNPTFTITEPETTDDETSEDVTQKEESEDETSEYLAQEEETDNQSTDETEVPVVNPLPGTVKVDVNEDSDSETESDTEPSSETDKKTSEENEKSDNFEAQAVKEAPTTDDDQVIPDIVPEPQEPATADAETEPMSDKKAQQEAIPAVQTDKKVVEDVPVRSAENYSAIDALPDPGETAAIEAKEGMQNPKIYDTKEYYVPIGQAHHKHGSFKLALLFGIICAVIVVGIVFYIMLQLGR
jgi:hypothetical protein